MPDVTIVYWRDIPAQVIVGKGRSGSKAALPERFEQAIEAAPYSVDGEPAEIAAAEAARLDAEYDNERLKALINAEGHATA